MIGRIIGFGLLLCSQAYAGQPLAQRFSRDVLYQEQAQQALLAVALDTAIYAASASDFRDLRLIDSHDVETPYWLQKIGGSKVVIKRLAVRGAKPKLEKSGEDGIIVTVDLEKDESAHVDGLSVVTSQRDFEYALQVQGSEDGKNWQPLLQNGMIYDYSRFMNFGNRDIELPGNSYRHFKIIVAKAVDTQVAELLEMTRSLQQGRELQRDEKIDMRSKPLHSERIELWHNQTETVAENERRFDYPVADFEVSRDADKQITQIEINAQFLPLHGLELNFATANFSRYAEVQVPFKQGIETRISTIASGKLEALHFKDFAREQTTLHFPEQRRQTYRVVIHDQDNPPLQFDGVTGIGPGYQMLFLPQPGQTYQLRYGAETAEMPHYDIAAIQELLRRGYQSLPAGLGPETAIAAEQAGFDLARLLDSDAFLAVVMTLMVMVLGWSLYRVGKRVG